ncbi:MAG: class I SAM-dependent methyltransferase [Lentimicrobium sp.]|jgi:2-polyprenyl-3-methyl-5-hydroxy-6-metoxy-1,4-benzoquinol methylase|nr:class I SAM-dependent methyltransferase [Lentimicrobium sp.]
MKDFWNERYANEDYAYGIEPNVFFKTQLEVLPKGKILFPAEGEGRNAVYAAQNDFEVYAFDSSKEGKIKAEKLAKHKNVSLKYSISSIEDIDYPQGFFDGIVLIFAHFPAKPRKEFHKKMLTYLKPNGFVIFEAFSKEQINNTSGGPSNIEMLISEEEIKTEFPEINFTMLETVEVFLDEGPFHQGKASVVRFIGTKNML